MSPTIDLVRIMNQIIRVMWVTTIMIVITTITITIIAATMRVAIIISPRIEAMSRPMIILVITQKPTTIIITNTHRNQTKYHRNTCTKYMSQHNATSQHPWTTTKQNQNSKAKAIAWQKINGMLILIQMLMLIQMVTNININSTTNIRILMPRIIMRINRIWPTISKMLLLMIISTRIRQAIHIPPKLPRLKLMTIPIVPKSRELTNLA